MALSHSSEASDDAADLQTAPVVIDLNQPYVFEKPLIFRAPIDDYTDLDLYGDAGDVPKAAAAAAKSTGVTAGKTLAGTTAGGGKPATTFAKTTTTTTTTGAKSASTSLGKPQLRQKPKTPSEVPLTPVLNPIRRQPEVNKLHDHWLRIFAFLDVRSIVRWSRTCRKAHLQVHCGVLQLLHPMIRLTDVSIDLHFWRFSITNMLTNKVLLTPLLRDTYKPLIKELRKCGKLGPIDLKEQSRSAISLSFDELPASYIQFADFEYPQKHTTAVTKDPKHPLSGSTVYCQSLTLGDLLIELCQRIKTAHLEEDASGLPREFSFRSESSSLLCLEHFLKAIFWCCIGKERGKVIMRRVELVKNVSVGLEHRIWLQCLLGWPELVVAPEKSADAFHSNILAYEHQLYFTVCDHFSWVM